MADKYTLRYIAFYIVRGKTVEIHRVVHGSRNLDDII